MIHQNLAGNPTARHSTGIAGHKNLRASTGTLFAKAGEPLAATVMPMSGFAMALPFAKTGQVRAETAKGLDG